MKWAAQKRQLYLRLVDYTMYRGGEEEFSGKPESIGVFFRKLRSPALIGYAISIMDKATGRG